MRYDFDRNIDRNNTNSSKWDKNEKLFGREDVLDMWVADMDFPSPKPVMEALKNRLEHPLFGYSFPPDSLYEAIIDRMERVYGWQIEKEWIIFTPGVITGLYAAIDALTVSGDEVVLQPPVYRPFYGTITNNGCQVVENQLKLEGEHYVMDYDDLCEHLTTSKDGYPSVTHRIQGLILCNPHNPGGRVWSVDELEQLADICCDNDVAIFSDEIHCDLLVGDASHTVMASLSPEVERQTVTFMAPSKTFNLAGLKASFAIIPNEQWREKINYARQGQGSVNELGLVAMEAALRDGDDYIEQLNTYLKNNVEFFCEKINNIPGLRAVRPQGTYLVWVDMRKLGLEDDELQKLLIEEAQVATNPGFMFGSGGEGFHRFNLACPKSRVEKCVRRIEKAVRKTTA